jgi:hypothetical protein
MGYWAKAVATAWAFASAVAVAATPVLSWEIMPVCVARIGAISVAKRLLRMNMPYPITAVLILQHKQTTPAKPPMMIASLRNSEFGVGAPSGLMGCGR